MSNQRACVAAVRVSRWGVGKEGVVVAVEYDIFRRNCCIEVMNPLVGESESEPEHVGVFC